MMILFFIWPLHRLLHENSAIQHAWYGMPKNAREMDMVLHATAPFLQTYTNPNAARYCLRFYLLAQIDFGVRCHDFTHETIYCSERSVAPR